MTPERFDEIVAELKAALVAPTGESPRPTPTPTTPPAQPPVVSSGDWQAEARDRAARQGFGNVLLADWDWSNGGLTFDTNARGTVGASGVFIASFIAKGPEDSSLAQIDAIGYPAPNQGNRLTLSLSTTPCDFSVAEPAISISEGPTITYCVGVAPANWWSHKAVAVGLVPGLRYYVNCSGRDSYVIGGRPGEFRVALRVPQGH
jgi:hypothetical protein